MRKSSYLRLMFAALGALSLSCSPRERDFGPSEEVNGSGGRGGSGPGGDGNAADPRRGSTSVELTTTELPDAQFNVAYEADVAADGVGSLVFEVSDGALPRGLTLDEEGRMTGVPTEDGNFTFTVTVTDDADATDSVELSLFVSRKPWLVYLGNDTAEDQWTLYAVDTSSALLTKTVVSTGLPAYGSVSAYEFSANGSRLAYTADVAADDVLELFIVDVDQDVLGAAVKLDTDGLPVGHFALTPSGNGVAYEVETTTDVWEMRFQDLTAPSAAFVSIGPSMPRQPSHRMVWLNEDRLLYNTTEAPNGTRVRTGGSFGAEEELAPGSITVDRTLDRAVVMQPTSACYAVSWLYDFTTGVTGYRAPADGSNWAMYSPDLSRVTLRDYGSGGHFVFESTATEGEPLGLISPTSFCADVQWSPGSDRIVTAGATYEYLQLTVVTNDLQTYQIEGDYQNDGSPRVAFVDNDWFLFSAMNELLEVRIEDGIPSEATAIFPVDAAISSFSTPIPSPDGKWAYLTAHLAGEGGVAPLLIDLAKERPITPRVVRAPLESVSYWGATFSPDSSVLAVESQSGVPGFTTLYVTNLLHPTSPGTLVSSNQGCTDWCRKVQSFQFQP